MLGVLGQSIPPDTAHAVSVSLPTWKANVGYEEGEDWVLSKMKTGYPRFFVHKTIEYLASEIVRRFGKADEKAIIFPTVACANRCLEFFREKAPELKHEVLRRLDLVLSVPEVDLNLRNVHRVTPGLSSVLYPNTASAIAKEVWQHTGEGISSRRAEFCLKALEDGLIVEQGTDDAVRGSARTFKGPRRYQKAGSLDGMEINFSGSKENEPSSSSSQSSMPADGGEYLQFIEERFGRNLDINLAVSAKLAIRRRIAGSLVADVGLEEAVKSTTNNSPTRRMKEFSEEDVYLYSCGMNAIFNTHRTLLTARGSRRSICFGFPYIDTLKVLEKWGPGSLFYGHGSTQDLDDLQRRLESGEEYLALFTEFPGNPLLKSPDLKRIRSLADKYDFAVVVDETVGNFMNIRVLPDVDIAVSSLTKVFSGDSNVMGGSAVLNPNGRHYALLKNVWTKEYEDNYWIEDAIFMERNSRDFVSRIERINTNAEAICNVLHTSPYVKKIYYPKYSPTKPLYDQYRNPHGGYGGLLSATFFSTAEAVVFFDALDTAKGPSLGTNFTLSSPYIILAHYHELDWAASFGVEADLVRVSVGLEDTHELRQVFQKALDAVGEFKGG